MTPYDTWKLASPDDESHEIGTEDGHPCNRIHEPDEDAPRGYKPKPCQGVMYGDAAVVYCGTCGEIA